MDIDILNRAPEHKAGVPAEPFGSEDVLRIFESYKRDNDARVAAIEKHRPDPLLEEKVARMDAALDGVLMKQARPPLGGAREPATYEQREHKAAFDAYVRHGESGNLRALEVKAMSVGSNADGGYTVPFEVEREIGKRLTVISPSRHSSSKSSPACRFAHAGYEVAGGRPRPPSAEVRGELTTRRVGNGAFAVAHAV